MLARYDNRARRVFRRERPRQRAAHPRRADGARGSIFQDAFLGQEFVEAAHRRQGALHPARTQPFLPPRSDKSADIGRRQPGQRFFRHRAAGMAGLKADEARHIIAISAQGMRRGAAFMRQRRQPFFAQRVGALAHLITILAFLASATKAARPLSVKGWLSSFLKISVGIVPTSAPARIDSRTWLTVRLEAARISVLEPFLS